jgi:hypothetical protein
LQKIDTYKYMKYYFAEKKLGKGPAGGRDSSRGVHRRAAERGAVAERGGARLRGGWLCRGAHLRRRGVSGAGAGGHLWGVSMVQGGACRERRKVSGGAGGRGRGRDGSAHRGRQRASPRRGRAACRRGFAPRTKVLSSFVNLGGSGGEEEGPVIFLGVIGPG